MSEKHPRPSITADVIVYDRRNKRVLLVERKHAPFAGSFALPGGFFNPETVLQIEPDATIEGAAIRELYEETGIDRFGENVESWGFDHYRDAIGRDPRGRVITFVFSLVLNGSVDVEAKDDAKSFRWIQLFDIFKRNVPLAFDHQEVLDRYFNTL